jgi:hypothetical protein
VGQKPDRDVVDEQESEPLKVQEKDRKEKEFGPEHPDALSRMANLVVTYNQQKRRKKTEKLGLPVLGSSSECSSVTANLRLWCTSLRR